MPKPTLETAELPARQARTRPKAKPPELLEFVGSDEEAFYAVQELAARASREYLARRRKR
jgi:hypothetical protein